MRGGEGGLYAGVGGGGRGLISRGGGGGRGLISRGGGGGRGLISRILWFADVQVTTTTTTTIYSDKQLLCYPQLAGLFTCTGQCLPKEIQNIS